MIVEFQVPEISEFPQGFPMYWMKSMFLPAVSKNYQVIALASTYVRLVEAALVEYRLGASKLREFWNTHSSINLSAIHRSVSHFESCISNMHRAINCFRRLRRHKDQDPLCLALNNERVNFAKDDVADHLRTMRNEIHHLDELVIDGRLEQGQPFVLMPNGPERPHPTETNQTVKTIDRLVIGGRDLPFASVAAWLTEMGQLARTISEFEFDDSQRGNTQ